MSFLIHNRLFLSRSKNLLFTCLFVFVLLFLPTQDVAQCACTPTSAFPTTVNGITISLSNTGSVTNYGANWPSCGLSAGPMWAGSSGAFTQTYTFSQPVNNVNYVITAASLEAFTFSVGSGVLTSSQCGGTCPFTQVGNTFTANGMDDGTTVVLSSTTPYTSITVTGPGGGNGSLVGLCVESIVLCPTPTISIIPSAAICQGAARTLTVTGATSYTWSPAASLSTTSGSVVVASPSVTTTYTVVAAGTGTCTTNAVTTVSVTPSPTVSISPATANICQGSSIALAASGATSYVWTPATALSNTNTANVTASPGTTTTYTVTGSTGTCTNSAVRTVSVTPLPTLTLTPTFTTICSGTSANLSVAGATNYTWSPATSLTNTNTANVTASPASTTTYTVIGANGTCTASAAVTVSVVTTPTPAIALSSPSICAGSSTSLVASGAGSYTWAPAGSLSSASLATVTASPATTTTYTLTGANGICTNTAVATLSVIAVPSLTVSPQTTTICAGSSTTLTASGSASYTWSPATGLSATSGSTVVASPASTTVYSISAGVSTCTSVVSATVNVNAIPVLTLTPVSTGICQGLSATLTAAGATNYTWSPSGSLNTSGGATVTATPTASTIYTVTGQTGICTSTATTSVNILASPTITISPQTSTICAGSSVTLTASGSSSYSWSPAASLNTASGSTVVASPAVGTTVYNVIGGISTCTAQTQATVVTLALPTLTVAPASSSICAGASATLSATGANSYTWTPAAALTTGSVVTVTPASSTIYTVTGATGSCTASTTATLTVVANPTLTIVPNTTVCAGNTATLTVSGASSYTWNPSTALSAGTGSVVTTTPVSSQGYTITGSLNSCTASASTSVTVIPRPVIVMGPDADICSGSSATLTASGAASYSWTPATGLGATTGTFVVSPSVPTSYTVTGTTAGCSSNAVAQVTVTPTPTLVVNSSPSSVCRGLSSTLSVSGATAYTWSPSGALSDVNLPTTTASPVQTTTYTVIGATGSCVSSATLELTIIQTATIQASKFGDVCLGESTTIEAIGGTVYNWAPVVGLSNANGQSTDAGPLATTIYTVTASAPGLCASTATVEVKVNPLPHVFAGRDTTINIDETITLTGTGDVEVGFLSPASGPLACNFCNQITVNPQESTCYVLKGENGYGCVDYDTVCVYVTRDFDVFIPNAFTPNEDGYNDVFIPVGYGIEAIRLTIFDRWGVQIFTSNEKSIGWDGTNKGKQCEQGVYVYKAEIKTMAGHTVQRVGHVTLLPRAVSK